MPISYKIINTDIISDGWLRHTIEFTCDDLQPNIIDSIQVEDYGKPEQISRNIKKYLEEFSEKCLSKIRIDIKPLVEILNKTVMEANINHGSKITEMKVRNGYIKN